MSINSLISIPQFEVTIPNTNISYTLRCMVSGEYKIFLTAKAADKAAGKSGDKRQVLSSIKQVLQQCMITTGVDVGRIPLLHVEYMFIQLFISSKSVDKINIPFTCNMPVHDKQSNETVACKHKTNVSLDISKTTIPKLKLTDQITDTDGNVLIMKMPCLNDLIDSKFDDEAERIICTGIQKIIGRDGREYIAGEDFNEDEIYEFLYRLRPEDLEKLNEFYSSIPKITLNYGFVCRGCGHKHDRAINSILDFFLFV